MKACTPTPEDKLLSTLGLCARARKLVMGTPMVCEAMRDKKTPVIAVLEASDTSENTHKKLSDKCAFYRVPLYRLTANTEALGRAVGKTGAVAAVGVTDASLYKALAKHLPTEAHGEATQENPNE
jgi:ribosomal protein L7Ae-like RNA K-turn-binding protein